MSKDSIEYVHALIKKANEVASADEAMRFSQAACNAANALATLKNTGLEQK